MFTDTPTTPMRLEVFLDLVWEMRQRKLDRDAIRKFLQPNGLPDLTPNSRQAFDTLNAAKELGLVTEAADGSFRPGWNIRRPYKAGEIIREAIDEKVLASTEIEPWFSRFYAYVIAQENDVVGSGEVGIKWAGDFNRDVYGGPPSENPFNQTKYTGLRRWMRYAGLGWHDSQDNFIPAPYDRVLRKLDEIFGKKRKLGSDEFMEKLAVQCPELDNGKTFREVNKGIDMNRTSTRALSTVLRDLHDDKVIRLDCPADSRGWSLIRSGEIRNRGDGLISDVVDHIKYLR